MFPKGLWLKEYMQIKWLLWIIPVLGIASMSFYRIDHLRYLHQVTTTGYPMERIHETFYGPAGLNISFQLSPFMYALLFVIAVLLFGFERRGTHQDFTFSLPFSRKTIFLTKWVLPLVFLAGTYLICFVIDVILIQTSQFSGYFNLAVSIRSFIIGFLLYVLFYTYVVAIGTMTGSASTQVVVSLAFAVIPVMFIVFLNGFLLLFFHMSLPSVLSDIKFFDYLYSFLIVPENQALLLFIITVMLVWIANLCYVRNPVEKNGKAILYKGWEVAFRIGATISAATFFAAISENFSLTMGTDLSPKVFVSIAFILGLVLTHFILMFLMGRKFKF